MQDMLKAIGLSLLAVVALSLVGLAANLIVTDHPPSEELVAWTQWIVAAAGAVVAATGILKAVPRLGESEESKFARRKAELVAGAAAVGLKGNELQAFLEHNNLTKPVANV